MFLLVPAHPGFPGQIPQSRKMVVCVCVTMSLNRKHLEITGADFKNRFLHFKSLSYCPTNSIKAQMHSKATTRTTSSLLGQNKRIVPNNKLTQRTKSIQKVQEIIKHYQTVNTVHLKQYNRLNQSSLES